MERRRSGRARRPMTRSSYQRDELDSAVLAAALQERVQHGALEEFEGTQPPARTTEQRGSVIWLLCGCDVPKPNQGS